MVVSPSRTATAVALAVRAAFLLLLAPSPSSAAPFDFSGTVTAVSASPGVNVMTLNALDPNAGGLVSLNVPSGSTADLVVNGGAAAWSSGSIVYYYIYDPYRREWTGGNSNGGTGNSTFNLRNTNGVVAWTMGSTARYAAYDWTRSQWRTDTTALGATANVLEVVDGVAAVVTGSGVFYAAYDPRAGLWKKGTAATGAQFVNLINAGGIVAWTVGASVQGRAYDPLSATWKTHSAILTATATDLKNEGGVMAWAHTPAGGSLVVGYAAYDGPRAGWSAGSVISGYTTDLTISNSTVVWTTVGGPNVRGYNALSGAWTANVSTPRAFFLPSIETGNAPFTVVFLDLSIGATGWSWNFGESLSTSTRRSPIFRYTTFGQFFVTETVSGPGGISVTNGVIRTDLVPPTGILTIDNGAATTTNLNVTLQLSATDNSGNVAAMRFSNDATAWSNWENYAVAKSWTLSPNAGTKTVYAQFRDGAANVSTNVSDTIQYDSSPPPTVTVVNANVAENAGQIIVTAVLDHAVNRVVSVNFATSDGTGSNGEDYTSRSGLLYFPPNTTSATFTLPILPDSAVELDETVFVNLSNPTNAVVSGPGAITIVDDDFAAASFATANFNVGEDAGSATVGVRLNAASSQTVSVRVVARAGTADGLDFVATNALLIFSPGQTNRTFNVSILEDQRDELTETVSLSLTNLTNGVIGVPAQSTISILDNDQPILSFSADSYTGFEDEFSIAVNVRLSKPFSQQVSAAYTIFGGTATPGVDYTILGTIIIPPTVTNATITIFPINDGQRESDETIRLRLTDIAGASAGRAETTVTILDDDGAPRFLAHRIDGTTFHATIRGRANQSFTLQVSANFVDWSPAGNMTIPASGILEYNTPATGLLRFFRTTVSP